MRWWWFWRENNRNKIPLIPTPHFHPQFSYSLHHDHYCHISMVSSLLPPRHPPMHFYCFQHHQHHISILLSPPPPSPKQPHFSSFPSTTTITTLLLFSHHHHIFILYYSPPLPPPHFYSFTGHFITSRIRVQSLILQSRLNVPLWRSKIVRKNNGKVVLAIVEENN